MSDTNMVVNGNFDTDVTGWDISDGTMTAESRDGALFLEDGSISQSIPMKTAVKPLLCFNAMVQSGEGKARFYYGSYSQTFELDAASEGEWGTYRIELDVNSGVDPVQTITLELLAEGSVICIDNLSLTDRNIITNCTFMTDMHGWDVDAYTPPMIMDPGVILSGPGSISQSVTVSRFSRLKLDVFANLNYASDGDFVTIQLTGSSSGRVLEIPLNNTGTDEHYRGDVDVSQYGEDMLLALEYAAYHAAARIYYVQLRDQNRLVNGSFDADLTDWHVEAFDNSQTLIDQNGRLNYRNCIISQKVPVIGGESISLYLNQDSVFAAGAGVTLTSWPSGATVTTDFDSNTNTAELQLDTVVGDSYVDVQFFNQNINLAQIYDISLLGKVNDELVINGNFDDGMTGWDTREFLLDRPRVTEGYLQLPVMRMNVYTVEQRVTVVPGRTLSLSYSMVRLSGIQAIFSISSTTTGDILYSDGDGGDISGVTFVVPDDTTELRMQFFVLMDGEVNVDNISMKYV